MNRWQQAEALFEEVMDMPADVRQRFLADACGTDAELRREVEELLAADSRAGAGIAAAIERSAQSLFADHAEGLRTGAYRVVREIGHGGMGTVFLAFRDDDEFHKQVAIKLIRRGMDTEDLLRRFRAERQILAGLEHPYIARLLDGGVASDGRPFLAMEYIQGEPLDLYCASHGLDLRARCRLFLKICEAVSFAHRNLVVHRDLKPGNILVDATGSPKLLDFGVAKLMDPERTPDRTATHAAMRPITPEYASPEQFRGEVVTTAADVYSLGAIFYEMLSGVRAHQFSGHSWPELERVICDGEPLRMSETTAKPVAERAELRGDVDAIAAKAMRKEPGLRYASVDQLADDVQRYLDGFPVVARQGTFAYRTRKFLRRNALAMTAGGLILAAILAGAGATLWQARRARQQQALAELRLADMLDLANRSLFDVHDEIAKLPGSTEARKRIAASTTEYLARLKQQANDDPRMLTVLSQAYRRLGDVQGSRTAPSLGDTAAALASFREAERFASRLMSVAPGNSSLLEWVEASSRVASLLSVSRTPTPEAFAVWDRQQRLLERAMAAHPSHEIAGALAVVHQTLAFQWAFSRPDQALTNAQRAIQLMEPLVQSEPDNDSYTEALGVVCTTLARIQSNLGRFPEAAAEFQKAIELARKRAARRPTPGVMRDLAIAYSDLGNLQFFSERPSLGDWRASLDFYRKALAVEQPILAGDPADRTARRDTAFMLMRIGCRSLAPEMAGDERAALEKSAAVFEDLAAHDPHNRDYRKQLAENMTCLGDYWRQTGNPGNALAAYQKGQQHAKAGGIDAPALRQGEALALAASGRAQEAVSLARGNAEQQQAALQSKAPADPARIWSMRAWLTAAEVSPAGEARCQAVHRARQVWNGVPAANQAGFAADRDRLLRLETACANQ